MRLVPLKCKGKFCPTCATGESQKWAEIVAQDVFSVTHRHVVFTIDKGLRDIFMMKNYRETLLKGLMDEAAGIILNFFEKRKIKAGVIATIHTFGSQLEFNPHVHMIVTMGGITQEGEWKPYDYLLFALLRKYWQTAVLKLIRRTLSRWDKSRVQAQLQAAYKNNPDGFYVYAPKRSRAKLRGLLEYISRYMKRGPIALSRIKMYDGEMVMFEYKDKRTGSIETRTMTAKEFIGALIRHIADYQFKTIRRYGVYSRRIKTVMKKILEVYQKSVRKQLVKVQKAVQPKKWRERITEEFGEDPLKCSRCGEYYEFMGMSVHKNGRLKVQYMKNKNARAFMNEENERIGKEAFQTEYEKAEKTAHEKVRFDWEKQRQFYLSRLRK